MKKVLRINFKYLVFFEIFFFFVCYSLLSVVRHQHFDSFAFDVGIYDQATWQYSRFKIPYNTIKGKLILADHFTPTLILLAPLYWLWNNILILFLFQAFWIAQSAYPIFLLAKEKKLSGFSSFVVSGLYLSFYGIQNAINFDFHEIMVAVGLLPWLLLFLERKNFKIFFLLFLPFLGCKENLAFFTFGLGIILFLKNFKAGFSVCLISLLYSLFVFKFFFPLFSPNGYEYQPDFSLNFFQIIQDLFSPFEKTKTWFYSLAWFSFLPIFSPKAIFLVF